MSYATRSYGGLTICCLNFEPDWSVSLKHALRWATNVTSGRTGREARRTEGASLSHTVEVHLVLIDAEAQAFRQALATLGTNWVGLPLWSDLLLGSEWSARVFDPQAILDIAGTNIVAGGSSLTAGNGYAPLLVGHIDTLPEISALTDGMAELVFTVTEDSPWAFRVGINATGTAGTWPATLEPNWISPPITRLSHGLEFEQIGEQRERAIGGIELPFKHAQEADFTLTSRTLIRTLAAFFAASQGSRKKFTSPLWFAPGTPTTEAPASTTVRFGSDTLQLSFETDGVVNVRVAMVQLPREISPIVGETPEQPARVYLYKYTYLLPTPIVYRFTNWPHELIRTADGTYAPAPMKHQTIGEGITFQTEEVTVDSFIFAGNPLNMFTPLVLEARLTLAIYEIETDPVAADSATLRSFGAVQSAPQKGRAITARAVFLAGLFDRQVPAVLISPNCQTYLFSTRCGLVKASYAKSGTLAANTGTTLTVTSAATDAANVFTGGTIEIGSGATWEKRAILSSTPITGGQTLVVDWPVRQAATGQAVSFYRGCDRTKAACQALGNFERFRGHPNLPLVNLSLPSANTSAPAGKK